MDEKVREIGSGVDKIAISAIEAYISKPVGLTRKWEVIKFCRYLLSLEGRLEIQERVLTENENLLSGLQSANKTVLLLEDKVKELENECQTWKDTAKQEMRNKDYYVGLLDEIARVFGKDAFLSDDGSIQDSPLRAKMPELVIELASKSKELREGIERISKILDEDTPFVIAHIEQVIEKLIEGDSFTQSLL